MLLLFHREDRGIQSVWASWPRSPKQEMAELGFRCYSTTEPRAPTSCLPSLALSVLPASGQGFFLFLRRSGNLLLSSVPPQCLSHSVLLLWVVPTDSSCFRGPPCNSGFLSARNPCSQHFPFAPLLWRPALFLPRLLCCPWALPSTQRLVLRVKE